MASTRAVHEPEKHDGIQRAIHDMQDTMLKNIANKLWPISRELCNSLKQKGLKVFSGGGRAADNSVQSTMMVRSQHVGRI